MGSRLRCGHDEIRLPGNSPKSRLASAVAVRVIKAGNRRPRHQEAFEYPIFHHIDAARLHTLIVVEVIAGQFSTAKPPKCRIEINRKGIGKNLFADFLLERLRFVFVFLPMPLDPVAKDLVKEDSAGAAGKNRGTRVRLNDGRILQSMEVGNHLIHGF